MSMFLLRLFLSPFLFLRSLTKAGWSFALLIGLAGFIAYHTDGNALPFLVCMALVAALALSALVSALSMRSLTVHRRPPARIWAGQTTQVEITLTNQARLMPCGGLVIEESLADAPGRPGGDVFAPIVPAGHTARLFYRLKVRRRGAYHFAPTRLSSNFPLGLITNQAVCNLAMEWLVYPRLVDVSETLLAEADRFCQQVRHLRNSMTEEDFRGLREFRHGDNPKWIHWRSSARRHELLVREWERPEVQRVTVILDTYSPPNTTRRAVHLERGISFAAGLVRETIRRGYETTFAAFAPRPTVLTCAPRQRNVDALYEALARLTPTRDDPVERIIDHLPPGALAASFVVVITPGAVYGGSGGGDLSAPFRRPDNRVRVVDLSSAAAGQLFTRRRDENREARTEQTAPRQTDLTPRLTAEPSA